MGEACKPPKEQDGRRRPRRSATTRTIVVLALCAGLGVTMTLAYRLEAHQRASNVTEAGFESEDRKRGR